MFWMSCFTMPVRRSELKGGDDMCLAIPGRVLSKQSIGGVDVGQVQFGGIVRQVALGFVPEVEVGDYVMVHVGFAISRVDEAEAKRTYELLEQLGALEEELGPAPVGPV
jgi:hydrogenase expression/formation protein HypC